jgi:hypothetical protein
LQTLQDFNKAFVLLVFSIQQQQNFVSATLQLKHFERVQSYLLRGEATTGPVVKVMRAYLVV